MFERTITMPALAFVAILYCAVCYTLIWCVYAEMWSEKKNPALWPLFIAPIIIPWIVFETFFKSLFSKKR